MSKVSLLMGLKRFSSLEYFQLRWYKNQSPRQFRHFFLLFPDLPDVTSLELFAHTVLPVFRSA